LPDPVEVWIIRHGETEWSITGQHSGRIDLPLTIQGEDEARAVSGLLDRRSFDLVLCSPLRRARRTCELAGFADVAKIDPDLQEWDYGDCTGYTQEQLREHTPAWTIWNGPVPNGESAGQIGARARRLAERLRILGGRNLLFSHGHFLRVLTAQWLGLPPQAGKHFALETSGLSVLGEDAGCPAILAWNLKNCDSRKL
jgi:probable phosphoglycerate mutase